MNFLAIDFETATGKRSSACAVGLATVKDDTIVDVYRALISPPGLQFSGWITRFNGGITAEDVKGKPTMAELWPSLQEKIGDQLIVAHNANFDMGVLAESLAFYGICPALPTAICSCALSKSVLPDLKDHKLPTVAEYFGIELNHHEPGSDACVCAQISMKLFGMAKVDMSQLITNWGINAPAAANGNMTKRVRVESTGEPDPPYVDFSFSIDKAQVFFGIRFVFTGEMESFDRGAAEAFMISVGAHVSSAVSRKTNYLVVSNESIRGYNRSGKKSGKLAKAFEVRAEGHPVNSFYSPT